MNDKLSNFVQTSEQYFNLIENFAEMPLKQFLTETQIALLQINLALLALPETKPISKDPAYDDFKVPANLFENLSKYLHGYDAYRLILGDPLDLSSSEQGNTHLTDDLVDIYVDLKTSIGFLKLDPSANSDDTIWQLRFDFHNHWGSHLMSVLNLMHYILAEHSDLD